MEGDQFGGGGGGGAIGRGVITITPSWRGAVVEEAADDGLLLGRDW